MSTKTERNAQSHEDEISSDLKDIKRLLVLLLVKGGTTQAELARALDAAQSTVSTQFRMGQVKPLEFEVHTIGEE